MENTVETRSLKQRVMEYEIIIPEIIVKNWLRIILVILTLLSFYVAYRFWKAEEADRLFKLLLAFIPICFTFLWFWRRDQHKPIIIMEANHYLMPGTQFFLDFWRKEGNGIC